MKNTLIQFFYEVKFALHSMKRHLLLSFSAMSAIMVTLMLVSVLLVLEFHLDSFVKSASAQTNVHVIMETDLPASSKKSLQRAIESMEEVSQVVYSSKEEELELLIKEKGEAFAMYRDDNPLNDAFFVYVQNPEDLEAVSQQISHMQGVYATGYGGSSASRFLNLLKRLRLFSWVVVIALLALSLYLIYNTIQTAIDSRSMEIAIMRQVGATDNFIRVPFEIEGILTGLGGAVIPFLLIWLGYPSLYDFMGGRLFANVFSLIPPATLVPLMGCILFGTGLLLGAAASLLAVNKYIKETR